MACHTARPSGADQRTRVTSAPGPSMLSARSEGFDKERAQSGSAKSSSSRPRHSSNLRHWTTGRHRLAQDEQL